jgi:glutathione S-transferase
MTRAVRPRWLLEELGVPYEVCRVDLSASESPEYLAIHPLGAVPALEDGDLRLMESAAICMYLADKFPEKGLAPAVGTRERALYYQWVLYAMATLEPPTIDYYAARVLTPIDAQVEADVTSAQERFADAAAVLEKHMTGREWLLDSGFSAADVVMVSLLAWSHMMGLLAPYPNLTAYMKRGGARPANKRARAD